SMGRVLLAGLSDDELDRRLSSSKLVARTAHTLTDPVQLREEIMRVRQQGWALIDEELERGLISLATPVHTRNGKVLAAINVGMHKSRMTADFVKQDVLPKLLATARQINERILQSGAY